MRQFQIILLFTLLFVCAKAQNNMNIFTSYGSISSYPVSDIDSMNTIPPWLNIYLSNGSGSPVSYYLPTIDSIKYSSILDSIPSATTGMITLLTDTTASCDGSTVGASGAPPNARGICWSKSSPPTTSDFVSYATNPSFNLVMNGLEKDTTYHVRAFATNVVGTAYGATRSFIAGNDGVYTGTWSGHLVIPVSQLDTIFSNLNMVTTMTATPSPNTYNISMDWSELFGAQPGVIVPVLEGTLNGTTLTVSNSRYVYQGIVLFIFNGTIEFDPSMSSILNTSTITVTGDATGYFNVNGTN